MLDNNNWIPHCRHQSQRPQDSIPKKEISNNNFHYNLTLIISPICPNYEFL
jgi:hypothetical protein